MKKYLKLIIVAILIVTCLAMLTGCDTTLSSAYNQAVEDGFVGTEAEWLASLTQGESAYDIAVDNGFAGTEAEWIASLSGDDGTDGSDGVDGANGANGVNGIDGEDGSTIEDMYAYACTVEGGSYTGSFLDFLQDYIDINITNNTQVATNLALRSAISVYSTFTIETTSHGITSTSQSTSAGSGIIYQLDKTTGDAYFITNYHVVYDASSNSSNHIAANIIVFLYGMEYADNSTTEEVEKDYSIAVEYVGGSMTYDIAVLKVTGNDILKTSDAVAVTLADSNEVAVGSSAIAIGNPEAEGLSATAGIVSVDSEFITMTAADEVTTVNFRVMRIDTAINSGNSGGGLFNSDGELIGIVNAKTSSTTIENIGYAIPSNLAVYVAQNIIDNCDGTTNESVQKCLIGVTVETISSSAVYDSETLTTKIVETMEVNSFSEVSAGRDAGLLVGDILKTVTINGVVYDITRSFILVDLMLTCRVGDTIIITVERTVDNVTSTIPISIALTSANVSAVA